MDLERASDSAGVYCKLGPFTNAEGVDYANGGVEDADRGPTDVQNDAKNAGYLAAKNFKWDPRKGRFKYAGPTKFEALSPPCCQKDTDCAEGGSSCPASPHKKDENGNFVDHVHLEDAWAYGVFSSIVTEKVDNVWCPTLKSVFEGISSDKNDVCGAKGTKPICELGGTSAEDKIYKKTITKIKELLTAATDEEGCKTLFRAFTTGGDPEDGKDADLFEPPFLYGHFDRATHAASNTDVGPKVKAWQVALTKHQLFKDDDTSITDVDASMIGAESANHISKGRAKHCASWYHVAVAGNGGGIVRAQPRGGLSSELLTCEIVDMQFPGKYVPGKNRGCRGQAMQSKVYRACGAPMTMGISGTVAHTLRVARSGAASDLSDKAILAVVAYIILGGHHTLTEATLTALDFAKAQKNSFAASSDMERKDDEKPTSNNEVTLASWKQPPPESERPAKGAYNAEKYLEMVTGMYSFANKKFPNTFKVAVDGLIPEAKYKTIRDKLGDYCGMSSDLPSDFYDAIQAKVPFDLDGLANSLEKVPNTGDKCIKLWETNPPDSDCQSNPQNSANN